MANSDHEIKKKIVTLLELEGGSMSPDKLAFETGCVQWSSTPQFQSVVQSMLSNGELHIDGQMRVRLGSMSGDD